jgi:guanylate kinase
MYKHIALVAVSGTGKGTVSQSLFALVAELMLSISATTRPPRNGETHGKEYYFHLMEEIKAMITTNKFAEWNQYNGNIYGTLHAEIERIEKLGRSILFDIDINGAVALKKSLGDRIITVFLDAPIEVCEARLRGRGTESEEYIQERLRIGREEEIPRKGECDHIVFYGEGAKADFTASEIASLAYYKLPEFEGTI